MVDGYGPIPEAVARNLVSKAVTDTRSQATLRRFYHHPRSGALVVMESRTRCFPKGPARFIGLRDQRCRTSSFVMPQSVTATTPSRVIGSDRSLWQTGSDTASSATMSRKNIG
ncbi:hypothetical protein [Mycobacterium lepromatosis]|uniref:hypothetical protein n=1 Tax=Mycobacterium lepromatosis TaxID=480418 RepID=UPI000A80089D|nr:hypothetical protein [Mycobacterium lepromatosis]